MSNKLNQLLENAKGENPLLTENDIISVINNHSLLGKKQTFFTLKNILMMSIISSIIIGLWIGFHPTATTNLAEPLQAPSPAINDSLEVTPTADKLLASANKYRQPTKAKKAPAKTEPLQAANNFRHLPEVNKKQETVLFKTTPFTPQFNENPIDDNRHYFDENGYLILSKEELAKLGIITDGNVLKYENATDSIELLYSTPEKKYMFHYFYLNIEKHGSRRINKYNFEGLKNPHKKSCSFYPTAIIVIDKKDSSLNLLEPLGNFGFEKEFFDEVKENLIPVALSLIPQPGKYSHYNKLIFWFKPEKSFLDSLPFAVATKLTNKLKLFNKEYYAANVLKYRKKITNGEIQKGFDSLTVAKLKHHFIELNKDQLKSVGIKLSKKGFHFKSYQNIDNKTQKLDVRVKKHYTLIGNNDNLFQRKRKNTPFRAVAKTDIHIKHIDYLMQFSDSITYSNRKEISKKYFRENIQKLIPIKVDADHVIWFEPTGELKRIINPNVNALTNNKLNLIPLNDEALAKLNIYSMLGKIEMPMKLNSGKTMQVTYSEKGSSLEFDALTSDEYYKLPIEQRGDSTLFRFGDNIKQWFYQKKSKENTFPPLLITSEDGKSWLINSIMNNKDSLTESDYTIIKENGLKTKDYPKAISIDIKYKNDILNRIKYYIPILVKAKTNDTIEPFNLIMWYEPSEDFFNSLPIEMSNQIKTEYNAISNNLPAPSCKYFEVCQNVSGKINSYLAYPNPAEQTINIEIDLAEERNLAFIVTDITGKIIKTLNPNLKQAKGIQTYTYQIGELSEGMYLLVITTDKGEKVSTRIVKK